MKPGHEASSAVAFELGDLFPIIPTTVKSSCKEGVYKNDRSLDYNSVWVLC